jgi:hypothetical protein
MREPVQREGHAPTLGSMTGDWAEERRLPDFLELTLVQARALAGRLGLEVRVVRDGPRHYGQKMNLSQRRVNLWLDEGHVTEAQRF